MPAFSAAWAKISRITAVSLACWFSSGGASAAPCVADLISASTRACGTGLPLTMATFCAITANGSTRVPISAAEDLKFMLGDFRANGFGREQERRSSWGVSPCRRSCSGWGNLDTPGHIQKTPIEKLYRESPARKQSGSKYSDFVRRAGIDGERMDALGHPGAKGIIHEAMSRNAGQ